MHPHTRWSELRTSFQFKLFLIFTLTTFLIACLLSTLYVTSEISTTRHEAAEQLMLRTTHLADSVRLPLYANNLEVLRTLAGQVAQAPEIRTVIISSPDGTVLAEAHGASPSSSQPTSFISQTAEVRSSPLVDSVEASLSGSNTTSTSMIGSVRIERGTEGISRTIRRVIILSTGVALLFWLMVSLLSFFVLQKLTRSFNRLIMGIKNMQEGDISSRIEILSEDEPGRAARAVNNLANALQQRSEENSCLQEERLDLERQILNAQKLESLGVMAGGIAHDFNNLLQSVLGNMELALMDLAPGSSPRKYIGRAMESANRAAHLTTLMLTYVGKGYITKKQLDLNEMVRKNVEMLQTAASKAVSIELCLAAELPVIMADDAQLQQVVMNLITNAAESIEVQPGSIRLTTGTRSCDDDCLTASLLEKRPEMGNFVFLEVSDNGCGMSAEVRKRLFEPFFTTKFTGRGLGMSAVMGIMTSHGGALFVESEPGVGTTFTALFPIPRTVPGETEKRQSHHHLDLTLEGEGTNILSEQPILALQRLSGTALVVDDEKSVLRVAKTMVTHCGFTVITAVDGVDAVAQFRAHADDIVVVLMDLTMPNMNGLTAMSEIYAIRPDVKIILASGFNEEELSGRLTGQPPSGFIRKPYNMKGLEAELRRVVPM